MGRTSPGAFGRLRCRLGRHRPYVEPYRGYLRTGFVEDYGTVEFDGICQFTYSGPVRRYCGACGADLPGHEARVGDRAEPERFTSTAICSREED